MLTKEQAKMAAVVLNAIKDLRLSDQQRAIALAIAIESPEENPLCPRETVLSELAKLLPGWA